MVPSIQTPLRLKTHSPPDTRRPCPVSKEKHLMNDRHDGIYLLWWPDPAAARLYIHIHIGSALTTDEWTAKKKSWSQRGSDTSSPTQSAATNSCSLGHYTRHMCALSVSEDVHRRSRGRRTDGQSPRRRLQNGPQFSLDVRPKGKKGKHQQHRQQKQQGTHRIMSSLP